MKQSMEKEALRQIYLREMGIQVWYPRFQLPHTNTVRDYEWSTSAQAEPSSVSKPSANTEPSANEQPEETVQMNTAALTDSLERQTVVSPVAAAGPTVDPAGPLQFAFAYLPVSDNLAVICEIPYQSRGRLQAPIRSLLMRILEALSVQVRPGSTPVIHFHWPLYDAQPQPMHSNQPENELLNQGLESARQTLRAFLARQLTERPVPFVLIFSEQWPQYLFPADFIPADRQVLFRHPQFATQVLVTRGLHVMQADDSVKKPVWQQLQVLKAQIKSFETVQTSDLSADAQDDFVRSPKDEH